MRPVFYSFGLFQVDVARRLLLRNGSPVPLSPKVFDTLLQLIARAGQVVTKEDLLAAVWPDAVVEENSVARNISTLRKTLGESAADHHYVVTVPGRGYSFVATVYETKPPQESSTMVQPPIDPPDAPKYAPADEGPMRVPIGLGRDVQSQVPGKNPRRGRTIILGVMLAAGAGVAVFALSHHRNSIAAPFERTTTARLTSSGRAVKAVISPDGRYIAYTKLDSGAQSLIVKRTTTLHDLEIVPAAPVRYAGLTFSPDSETVYYVIWKPGPEASVLYRIPVMGGAPQKLTENLDSPITVSPDGKSFAFVRESSNQSAIVVSNLDTGAERKLMSRTLPVVLDYPAWSPDGRAIVCTVYDSATASTTGSNTQLIEVDIVDGKERSISAQTFGFVRQVAWLRDRSGLIVSARSLESAVYHLWLLSYPGGIVRKLSDGVDSQTGVSITADAGQIVTVEEHRFAAISRIDPVHSQNPEPVISEATGRSGPVWAPNQRILFEQEVNGLRAFWTVDSGGANPRQVTFSGDNFDPSISSNGRLAWISDRSGAPAIWTMDLDGGNAAMIAHLVPGSNPKISPDGNWVVYTAYGAGHWSTLWRVELRSGTARELNDRYWEMPVVSPDGKFIAGFYRDRQLSTGNYPTSIAVIGIDGGKPMLMLPTPLSVSYGAGLRWTRNGRELTYVNSGKDGDNIWSYPLRGGAPHQVTKLHGDSIFRFDWSWNGQQLVFSRGVQTRDVVAVRDSR